jgi:hypothetical protein
MDHALTWCFMTEFVLAVDLYRLILQLLRLHGGKTADRMVSDRYNVSGQWPEWLQNVPC